MDKSDRHSLDSGTKVKNSGQLGNIFAVRPAIFTSFIVTSAKITTNEWIKLPYCGPTMKSIC